MRVIKTCKRMGIKTVAVYFRGGDADKSSRWKWPTSASSSADRCPPSPISTWDKIIGGSQGKTGAEAIHPGFGFLSENAKFPEALKKEGIAWIGPNPHAISAMGDKLESKKPRRRSRG